MLACLLKWNHCSVHRKTWNVGLLFYTHKAIIWFHKAQIKKNSSRVCKNHLHFWMHYFFEKEAAKSINSNRSLKQRLVRYSQRGHLQGTSRVRSMSESGVKRPGFLLLYLNSKGWTCCISANVSYIEPRFQTPHHPTLSLLLSFIHKPHVFLMTPITDVQRQTLPSLVQSDLWLNSSATVQFILTQ